MKKYPLQLILSAIKCYIFLSDSQEEYGPVQSDNFRIVEDP